VQSIIERITRGNLWSFHGGIHPPEQKELTSQKEIRSLPLPKQLILPLQQHIGKEGDLIVNVGDKILKGQPLTVASSPMVVPIHAPTSGTIAKIQKSVSAHPSGLNELCLFIDVDNQDTWIERTTNQDYKQLSAEDIVKKIANAGIAGMGGAGFPTHVKVTPNSPLEFLIINGAECEPYITADDRLMVEQSESIVSGIQILNQILVPQHIVIAIEDNKPSAIQAMQSATKTIDNITVCVVPTKYPTGGEKQLIKILTGKEVPSGAIPINSGILMQNVATCFAIHNAVVNDTPLIQRVVTVTGQALKTPQNAWILLGTTIDFLLEQFDPQAIEHDKQPVIMGGPMMGFGVSSEQVPIVKTSNCILIPSQKEMPSAFDKQSKEVECIRCGECAVVCPSQLLPQELQWSAKAKDYPQLKKLNLSDCIDCGACAYVCPSQIPLVQYYRVAKAEIRQQHELDLKAEKAKTRFEARKLRLEKEKIAREQKHKKAAAARKAAMNKTTPEATGAKSAVAAALARVKAKKANALAPAKVEESAIIESGNESTTPESNQKSQVAAAIARAKAKRLAKSTKVEQSNEIINDNTAEKSSNNSSSVNTSNKDTLEIEVEIDDKKATVAAAIAKAKAKQLAKLSPDKRTTSEQSELIDNTKEGKQSESSDNSTTFEVKTAIETVVKVEDKKAKIASAIAKAKAKKLAKSAQQQSGNISTESTIKNVDSDVLVDDKKAKIAAAIAKAKAKKLAKTAAVTLDNNDNNQQKELT
jgi:electron transport complex protein RnfC